MEKTNDIIRMGARNSFIDRSDPRVAGLFKRLGNVERILDDLEGPMRRPLGGLRLLNERELAERLGISVRTIQEYRVAKVFPYYVVCGRIFYSEAEIAQFLEGRRQGVVN